MKYGIFAVKDSLNGFMNPLVDSNDPSAIRNFAHAMSDTRGIFYSSPSDFSLFKLGEFDSDSGIISAYTTPEFVDSGSNVYLSVFGGAKNGDI